MARACFLSFVESYSLELARIFLSLSMILSHSFTTKKDSKKKNVCSYSTRQNPTSFLLAITLAPSNVHMGNVRFFDRKLVREGHIERWKGEKWGEDGDEFEFFFLFKHKLSCLRNCCIE